MIIFRRIHSLPPTNILLSPTLRRTGINLFLSLTHTLIPSSCCSTTFLSDKHRLSLTTVSLSSPRAHPQNNQTSRVTSPQPWTTPWKTRRTPPQTPTPCTKRPNSPRPPEDPTTKALRKGTSRAHHPVPPSVEFRNRPFKPNPPTPSTHSAPC